MRGGRILWRGLGNRKIGYNSPAWSRFEELDKRKARPFRNRAWCFGIRHEGGAHGVGINAMLP